MTAARSTTDTLAVFSGIVTVPDTFVHTLRWVVVTDSDTDWAVRFAPAAVCGTNRADTVPPPAFVELPYTQNST